MPDYVYRCVCKNEFWVTEPMLDPPGHFCGICGLKMWRKPQVTTVHWGGLKPSDGELAPAVKNHIDNVDQIREETDEHYYERDQNKTT